MERYRTPQDNQPESRRKQALGLWGNFIKTSGDEDPSGGGEDSIFRETEPVPEERPRIFARPPKPPRQPGIVRYLLGYLYVS